MKADELTFHVSFTRIRRGLKVSFLPVSGEGGPNGPPAPLGKSLAMAHFFDQAMTALGPGTLSGLAGRWSIRPQHLAQVHALVYLAPDLQEAVLLSKSEAGKLTFHSLVAIAQRPFWEGQRETLGEGSRTPIGPRAFWAVRGGLVTRRGLFPPRGA